VLESNGRFLTADPLAARREYLKRRHSGVWAGRPSAPPAVVSAMTDTQFESYDKQQMIHASRIVEFRAWNVGEGELHAGFQDLSKIDFQTNVYRNLERKGLDVHVYGAGDEETVAAAEGMGWTSRRATTRRSFATGGWRSTATGATPTRACCWHRNGPERVLRVLDRRSGRRRRHHRATPYATVDRGVALTDSRRSTRRPLRFRTAFIDCATTDP
jgi:hypothetical protein